MRGDGTPSTPGATPGQGTEPGASGTTTGPVSQGPNDPVNPPATGGSQQPATGAAPDDNSTRIANLEAAMRRMGEERDAARTALEDEKRKNLTPEERQRLAGLDEQVQKQATERKSLILKYEIAAKAPKLGIVDPEVAVVLLERNPGITVSDDGVVTGLDEALKQLVKDKPFLVRATTQGVDAGSGTGGGRPNAKPGMNEIIRGAARGRIISQE
jgi:hypothetical protein